MVACKLAFIDCKLPGSDLKENYSMIGAGVTQSEDQVVNLTEPHGFSVGAAAMPAGVAGNSAGARARAPAKSRAAPATC
ncbi:hypothetical protein G6F46_015655 [Rhizopus delemar]|nr:hypothetical protein G6F46_015655 [Rhizopus delemar]